MRTAGKMSLALFLLAFFTVLWTQHIYDRGKSYHYRKLELAGAEYRREFFSEEMMDREEELSEECRGFLRGVKEEIRYFPVPESTLDSRFTVSFVDTWQAERNYRETAGHEGTDIMAGENVRGAYPVLSMADGVIVNMGWLEKGGWRVGVAGDGGAYYYYAHLDSYGNFAEGDRVKAGDLLGYMGDSGYGPEGTQGQFPVHLHIGIYAYRDGQEISVNPYFVLRYLENKKLKYAYWQKG